MTGTFLYMLLTLRIKTASYFTGKRWGYLGIEELQSRINKWWPNKGKSKEQGRGTLFLKRKWVVGKAVIS